MNKQSFVKLHDKDELRSAWLNYQITQDSFADFMIKASEKWLHWTMFHHYPMFYFFNKKKYPYALFKSKTGRYSELLCRTLNRDQLVFVDEFQFGVWDDSADEAKKILRIDCEEIYASTDLLGFIDYWKNWDDSVLTIEPWDQKK